MNSAAQDARSIGDEVDTFSYAGCDASHVCALAASVIRDCRARAGLDEPPPSALPAPPLTGERAPGVQTDTKFDLARAVGGLAGGPAGVTRTPVQQLETAVREFPSHPELYLELAPHYLSRGRLFDAERLLSKGVAATGQDVRVRQLWEDVTLMRLDEEIRLARVEQEKHDDDASRAALEAAEREQRRVKLEVLQHRTQREPDNGDVSFQLGRHLVSLGRFREAIKAFHQAIADPRFTPDAALEAGQCYEQEGDWSEALRLYRLASKPSLAAHRPDVRTCSLEKASQLATRLKLPKLADYYASKRQALGARAPVAPS